MIPRILRLAHAQHHDITIMMARPSLPGTVHYDLKLSSTDPRQAARLRQANASLHLACERMQVQRRVACAAKPVCCACAACPAGRSMRGSLPRCAQSPIYTHMHPRAGGAAGDRGRHRQAQGRRVVSATRADGPSPSSPSVFCRVLSACVHSRASLVAAMTGTGRGSTAVGPWGRVGMCCHLACRARAWRLPNSTLPARPRSALAACLCLPVRVCMGLCGPVLESHPLSSHRHHSAPLRDASSFTACLRCRVTLPPKR